MEDYIKNYIVEANLLQLEDEEIVQFSSLYDILSIFILSEMAVTNENNAPWMLNNDLTKRRHAYRYDEHLQQMLLSVKQIGRYSSKVIPCGTSGYYKTELFSEKGYCIHFNHSFDKNAIYNQDYLHKNDDFNNAKFSYFLYGLDNNKEKIKELKFVIPSLNQKEIVIDLTNQFVILKEKIFNDRKEIERYFYEIRERNSKNLVAIGE